MKSFFTKLGKLLLCGVAVAVVGCTDYDTDIQNVNERVDAVEADFEKAIADLQAELNANFATKAELAALETELNTTIDAAVAELNAAIATKADKAEVEAAIAALQKALADAKAELQGDIDANTAAIAGAVKRIEDLEATVNSLCEAVAQNTMGVQNLTTAFEVYQAEMEAQMDAVYAYIDTMEEEIYSSIQTVQEFASAINTLLAEEIERSKIEDEALWEKINTIETVCTNLTNLLALEEEERKAADDQIYQEIETLRASLASVYTTLEEKIDNEVAQINQTLEKLTATVSTLSFLIDDVDAALKAHIAAYEAFKTTLQEKIAQYDMAITNHETAIETLKNDVEGIEGVIEQLKEEDILLGKSITDLQEALTAAMNVHADDIAEVNSLIEGLASQIEATQQTLTMLNNLVQDIWGRVQSIVFVPEYNDHKGTIDFAIVRVDPNAENSTDLYVPAISVLTYKVNAEDASKVASTIALQYAENLSMEVKEVKVRSTETEAPAAALEIVDVTAKDEYLLVSVVAKNFKPEFFEGRNIYSTSLLLYDGNNDRATEFTNLVAAQTAEFTPVIVDGENKEYTLEPNETHLLPYDKADTTVVILKDNKLAFKDAAGNLVKDEVVAQYDLNVERVLKSGNTTWGESVEGSVKAEAAADGSIRRLYTIDFNVEENDFTFTLGDKFTKEDKGREFDFNVVYNVNGIEVAADSKVRLTNKLISYDVPAVVVPWTMGLADSLRVVLNDASVLYRNELVRNAAYTVPENFEGYSLYSIVQTGTTLKREVTVNGQLATNVDIQASIADEFVTLRLIPTAENGYAFPAYDAENDYNEYKITWVKEHESVTATITATLLLGKQPAPVAVDCGHATLTIDGENPFYAAEVNFLDAAYAEFDEALQATGVKFLGYADEATAKAAFKAALENTSASVSEVNTVKVGGAKGTEWNVAYNTGLVRFYDYNKAEAIMTEDGVQLYTLYETGLNDFWFEIPFAFELDATIDVPTNGLIFSTADYVTVVDETNGRVEVDGDIVDGLYTIDQADLGKYFNVSKDADNDNNLTVKFVVNTTGAPAPEVTDEVAVLEDENEEVEYFVLDEGQSVIKDWTNGNTFQGNEIEVEAILMVNGVFELDRKTVVLYTADPLDMTSAEGIDHTETRIPGVATTVKSFAYLTLTSTEEEGNLINVDGKTSKGLFYNSKANDTYGAEYTVTLKRVYTTDENGDHAYPTNKYEYADGVITLKADDGILLHSVFAEIEYTLTHNFNTEVAEDGEKKEVEVIKIEFKPASEDEYSL